MQAHASRWTKGRNNRGMTLVEMMVAVSILTVVGLLTFVVTSSATSATALAHAKDAAQGSVRDVMTALAAEVQLASKQTKPALIPPLEALKVENGDSITFQTPLDDTGTLWSTPITYRFVNEDGCSGEPCNARLDEGEDEDGDGVLTRRIVRVQDGVERPVGGANDLSDVSFQLNSTGDVLTITLVASKSVDNLRKDIVQTQATCRVHLLN